MNAVEVNKNWLTVPNCLQTIERERVTVQDQIVRVTRTHGQCCTQINEAYSLYVSLSVCEDVL